MSTVKRAMKTCSSTFAVVVVAVVAVGYQKRHSKKLTKND